jgi:hypothetical protein
MGNNFAKLEHFWISGRTETIAIADPHAGENLVGLSFLLLGPKVHAALMW